MGFEVFEFRGRTFSDETLLTISKAGVVDLNKVHSLGRGSRKNK
jgi:hypothetical protein